MQTHDAFFNITSPWGPMIGAHVGEHLSGLWFIGQAHFPRIQGHPMRPHPRLSKSLTTELNAYAHGELTTFTIAVAPIGGSPHAQAVWRALCAIPYGTTTTYGQLAQTIGDITGRASSPRAIGHAVARNPISILIPCHRVIGANGQLTGYAGGIEKKTALLRLEHAID